MGELHFATSTPIAAALAVIAAEPLVLAALARLHSLRGRNAAQFGGMALAGFAAWLAAAWQAPAGMPHGLLLLLAADLFYLEIWGLLSRGYTLGVLATLAAAGRPLDAAEIAARYRGGAGLEWILRHRLSGMAAAGLVAARGDRLELTPLGAAVGRCSGAARALLKLERARHAAPVAIGAAVALYPAVLLALIALGAQLEFWQYTAVYSCLTLAVLMAFGALYKSVSLRMLEFLLGRPGRGAPAQALLERYVASESFAHRLAVIESAGFAAREGERFALTPRGRAVARAVRGLHALYAIERIG